MTGMCLGILEVYKDDRRRAGREGVVHSIPV
jgi:hypothetical protein